jgi:AcrR family transcriptional regulator
MTPAQRWKRRKEARPQEILEAALTLFAEKGFAATRMDDIAARAGVTKGTIYLYFESKEAVFKMLVRESIGAALSRIVEDARTTGESARDMLRFALTSIGEFAYTSDRVQLAKIIVGEAGNFPELLRFYRNEIIDRGLQMLTAIIDRGAARGEFRKLPAEHVARICIAPVLITIFWRTTFAQFDAQPYDYRGLIETHIDVLLRGLSPDKGAA